MSGANERWVLEEPLHKVMIKVGLPVAAMQVLNVVYNIVDLYWLGRYSTSAIAAINASWPTFFLIVSVFAGLFGAGNALVSQSWGAGKYDYAVKAASQLIGFAIIGGLPLGAAISLVSPYLLSLITADPEVLGAAASYISIIALGLPLFAISFAIQSAYISIGRSWVVLRFIIIGNILNMVLDPVLIFGWLGLPSMGAAGAALATVISEGMAWVMGLAYFVKRGLNGHRPSARYFAPDLSIYRKVIEIGLPLSGSSFAEASGFYVLALIIGSMGTKALSSWGIGDRPFSIISIITSGLIAATSTVVGQSIGARDFEKAKRVVKEVSAIIALVTALLVLPMIALRHQVASAFSPLDIEVASYAADFILYMGPSLVFFSMLQVASAVANGSGHTKPLMALSMLRLWALRNALAYPLGPGPLSIGVSGLWIGMALSNAITGLAAVAWLFSYKWLRPVI